MSFDTSSFSHITQVSPNFSVLILRTSCFRSDNGIRVFSSVFIINVLLLPLFFLILFLGYQQCWGPLSSTTGVKMSHSDLFLYHSIAMQLEEFVGFTLFFFGGYSNVQDIMLGGLSILSVTSLGEALFHLMTCVERYIAVVHPIFYRGLRKEGAIRMRNIGIGCIWLLCFGCSSFLYLTRATFNLVVYFCIMSLFLSIICYCSFSLLHALKRPGPGEVMGNRARVDQSKQRAFHTIVAILGVLLFRFVGNLVCNVVEGSIVLKSINLCLVFLSAFWFYLPGSVVLPLLFLLRAGKLQCC